MYHYTSIVYCCSSGGKQGIDCCTEDGGKYMIKQALSSFYTKQKHTVCCFSFHRFSRLLCFIRLLSLLYILFLSFFFSFSPALCWRRASYKCTFSCSSSFFFVVTKLCVFTVLNCLSLQFWNPCPFFLG